MFGDFNSRAENEADILNVDEFLYELYGNEEIFEENQRILEIF